MGGTWDLDPDDFSFGFFFIFFKGDLSVRTDSPSPLEWLSFLPLVAAVSITPKGAESPGSGHIGVIGALFFFHRCRLG